MRRISAVAVSIVGLFTLAILYTLHLARDFFIPVAFASLLALMFGPAVMARWLPVAYKDGVDLDIISVAAGPYRWPNQRIEYVRREPPPGPGPSGP